MSKVQRAAQRVLELRGFNPGPQRHNDAATLELVEAFRFLPYRTLVVLMG